MFVSFPHPTGPNLIALLRRNLPPLAPPGLYLFDMFLPSTISLSLSLYRVVVLSLYSVILNDNTLYGIYILYLKLFPH